MRAISGDRLLGGLGVEVLLPPPDQGLLGVEIDSRVDLRDRLFFAIKGERFDGHEFLDEVLLKHPWGLVISKAWYSNHPARERLLDLARESGSGLLLAEDPQKALGLAAREALRVWQPLVIGITGSSGKTTTRRISETLLAGKFKVRTGIKNFNNDIGLPLTVFSLEEGDEILLLEMGMNHFGELSWLAEIARPRYLVITNIGSAHIEYFGTRARIAEAKKEALAYFDQDSVAILNRDDDFFDFLRAGIPGTILSFGALPEGWRVLEDKGPDGYLLEHAGEELEFALGGAHNLSNLSAAITLAGKLGLAESVIIERVKMVRPVESRSQVVDGRVRIINDSYNANPESMRAGLNLLATALSGRRVAVLADMLELGGDSSIYHGELGSWIAAKSVCDELILYGAEMAECGRSALGAGFNPAHLHVFLSRDELESFISEFIREGDIVLLKGSRGLELDTLMPLLRDST